MARQHTCRIVRRMVASLDHFLIGKISINTLFYTLEGSLHAIEEKLTEAFYEEWDRHWITFEMGLADNATNLDFYQDDVNGIRNLLLSICPALEEDVKE